VAKWKSRQSHVGGQTHLVGPSDGAILDFVVEKNSINPIVTHLLKNALRGAIALLEVRDEAKDLALMPSVGSHAFEKTVRID